jgi:hypothetical protein
MRKHRLKRAQIQRVSAIKIAQLKKQARILHRLKELLFGVPKRFMKGVMSEILFVLVRVFTKNKRVINGFVKQQLESNYLGRLPLKNKELDKYYLVVRELNENDPDRSIVGHPDVGWFEIKNILDQDPIFTELFKNYGEAVKYCTGFKNMYEGSGSKFDAGLNWKKLFSPLLSASQGKVRDIKVDKAVAKVYEKKAVSVVGQMGLATLAIFLHFTQLIGEYTEAFLTGPFLFLLRVLVWLPIKGVAKLLYSLFTKIYNRDPKEIDTNPPTEIMGLPLPT